MKMVGCRLMKIVVVLLLDRLIVPSSNSINKAKTGTDVVSLVGSANFHENDAHD